MTTRATPIDPVAIDADGATTATDPRLDVPTITPDTYNAFIATLDLTDVRVASAELRAPTRPQGRRLRPDVLLEATGYANDATEVRVGQRLHFVGHYEDDGAEALRVDVELEATYQSATRMDDAIFAEFQRVNLTLNTWPYFREFLHGMLVRAGWPPFVLPAFRVSPTVTSDDGPSELSTEQDEQHSQLQSAKEAGAGGEAAS